jgi:hypothetical protein
MENMEKFEDYRAKILSLIKSNEESMALEEIKKSILDAKNDLKKNEELYKLYSSIFDELFHDIVFERITISLQTKKLLETLALPVNTRTELMKEKLIYKNFKILNNKTI